MARWYPLEPADETFLTTAPEVHRYVVDLPVPPARVWQSLQSDESLAAWGPAVKAVNWLSPRPFGVGTRREVVLPLGLVKVREQFLVWDEGRRYMFVVTEASAAVLRRFAEDYVVEARGDGSRLTWTVASEPAGWMRRLAPVTSRVNEFAFGQVARSAKKYFAKHP